MEYKICYASSPEGLTKLVNEHIKAGWSPVGGHSVIETHHQNRFSGSQHMDTIIKTEYSQTLIKTV